MTTVYDTSAGRSITRENSWYQVTLEYDTAAEWLDEVVVKFYVMSKRMVKGREQFSFYEKSVKDVDIAKGRGHFATAYLRPNTVLRYGEVVAAAAEILVNGQAIGDQNDAAMKVPESWWKNPQVTGSPAVVKRSGYLLSRAETPFAFVNVDDFEVIK